MIPAILALSIAVGLSVYWWLTWWPRYRRDVWMFLSCTFAVLARKCFDRAETPAPPRETKVQISLAREWEKPVEMWRDEDQIMVMAGGRIVPFKR